MAPSELVAHLVDRTMDLLSDILGASAVDLDQAPVPFLEGAVLLLDEEHFAGAIYDNAFYLDCARCTYD